MSVIQIRQARREGARIVIGIAGVSGSGKTYTALQLAYGLAGRDAGKVGFLDTENRRGSLYADSLPSPFLIGDLYAPFSPQRYVDAILEFQAAGVEVLVIDSVTHEWEGYGGCEDIASQTKFPDWKRAKAEHKRFMNTLLQSNMHIIACIRAREKVDFSDPKNPRPLGLQPIQEKNFMFEMTASVMMHDAGKRQTVLKCPKDLQNIVGRGSGYLTIDDGMNLRQWVDGAHEIDAEVEKYRNTLQTVTESGLSALRDTWEKIPTRVKTLLGKEFLDSLKAAAAAYDAQKSQPTEPEVPAVVAALNGKTHFESDDSF